MPRKLLVAAMLLASVFATAQGGTTSSDIIPAVTGQNLGKTIQRWNLYAYNIDFKGSFTYNGVPVNFGGGSGTASLPVPASAGLCFMSTGNVDGAYTWQACPAGSGGSSGVSTFNGRTGAITPSSTDYSAYYAALAHTHVKANITDFPTTWDWSLIANKPASFASDWSTLANKPTTFAPPLPTASTLGGVKSLTCTGTDKFSGIGTDGIPVCSADQTGTSGTGITTFNGATQTSQTLVGGTGITVSTNTGTGATTVTYSGSVPVNADWSSVSGLSQILNKPTVPTSASWPNAGACGTNQFVTGISNGVAPSCQQVTYSQVSGTPTLATVASSGAYTDLSGRPTLGTAAALNVPAAGNAATTEVVKGSDTRLSDARTPLTHTHTETDVTGLTTDLAAKEVAANKSTNTALGSSNTLYPSQLAVKTYVDNGLASKANSTASTVVNGQTCALGGTCTVTAGVVGSDGNLLLNNGGVLGSLATSISGSNITFPGEIASAATTDQGWILPNAVSPTPSPASAVKLSAQSSKLTVSENGASPVEVAKINSTITGTAAGITGKTLQGTGTTIPLVSGAATAGKQLTFDPSGNIVPSTYDVGTAGSGVVGLTTNFFPIATSSTTLGAGKIQQSTSAKTVTIGDAATPSYISGKEAAAAAGKCDGEGTNCASDEWTLHVDSTTHKLACELGPSHTNCNPDATLPTMPVPVTSRYIGMPPSNQVLFDILIPNFASAPTYTVSCSNSIVKSATATNATGAATFTLSKITSGGTTTTLCTFTTAGGSSSTTASGSGGTITSTDELRLKYDTADTTFSDPLWAISVTK